MLKKIWKDPVGSKVIAWIIIGAIGIIVSYLMGFWPVLKSWIFLVIDFLGAKTELANWLIIILAIPFLIVVWALVAMLWESTTGNSKNISFTEYKKDRFFDVIWGWDYGIDHSIRETHCLCPECSYQIIPVEKSDTFRVVEKCELYCEDCGYSADSFRGTYKELLQTVTLKIQKNLRNGEWKQRISTGVIDREESHEST